MMRYPIALAALLPLIAEAASAQQVPAPVKTRVDEMVATCFHAGGRFDPPPGPNRFAVPRDLDGDGITDFVVAEGGFPCAGRPTLFRPDGLARLQIFLGDGRGGARLVFDQKVSGHRLVEGRPATLRIARLAPACGGNIPRCEDVVRFSGAGLALVPADGRPGGPVDVPPVMAQAAARPATSPAKKAGALPLRRGYFVSSDTPCNRASNASVTLVTADGMNGSRTACSFRKVEPLGGTRFRVSQSCQELGGWGRQEAPEVSTFTIEVPDDSRFTIRWEGGSSTSARHCPQPQMNEPFRSNDIRDILR